MKTKGMVFVFLVTGIILVRGQEPQYSVPVIGSEAPSFTARSTQGNVSFPDDYRNHWKILVSHPRDFTPVCSSELLELAQHQGDFEALGVQLLVLSTDPLEQHNTWVKTLDTLKYKDRKPVSIRFPLIEDNNMQVSRLYGMIHGPVSTTRNVRGVFIIDPANKVRATFFYPLEVGRNLDEILRTVKALQTSDLEHVYTPANWQPGDDVFVPFVDERQKKQVYYIAPFMIAREL
jgi:peroxiredoxin (alkyl hydroperoxide reductase subunit C)